MPIYRCHDVIHKKLQTFYQKPSGSNKQFQHVDRIQSQLAWINYFYISATSTKRNKTFETLPLTVAQIENKISENRCIKNIKNLHNNNLKIINKMIETGSSI